MNLQLQATIPFQGAQARKERQEDTYRSAGQVEPGDVMAVGMPRAPVVKRGSTRAKPQFKGREPC